MKIEQLLILNKTMLLNGKGRVESLGGTIFGVGEERKGVRRTLDFTGLDGNS